MDISYTENIQSAFTRTLGTDSDNNIADQENNSNKRAGTTGTDAGAEARAKARGWSNKPIEYQDPLAHSKAEHQSNIATDRTQKAKLGCEDIQQLKFKQTSLHDK